MVRYCPQELFDSTVVTIAWGSHVSGQSLDALVPKFTQSVKKQYADKNLDRDASKACTILLEHLKVQHNGAPPEMIRIALACLRIQFKKYRRDGTRKPWRLLNGSLFVYSTEELHDKVEQFNISLLTLLYLQSSGRIPMPTENELAKAL